jgi:5-methylcytosine-specific restriction protein A
MKASSLLQEGVVYSRADLHALLEVGADPAFETGVYRAKPYDSILLFVTEKKSADRTQYEDRLDGDRLYWDGQMQGRTDAMIRDHRSHGFEILVLYRTSRREHPHADFVYVGQFDYVSSSGQHPTHFVFQRTDSLLAQAARDIAAAQVEEEARQEGGVRQALVNRYERDAQLRAAAIRLHGTDCKGCGFSFETAYGAQGRGYIEVHHLIPISTYGEGRLVDPATEMTVLCANCHRMVHRNPEHPVSLEELRTLSR